MTCDIRRPQIVSEGKMDQKFRTTRDSVKKLMKPMASIFKGRHGSRSKRVKLSPAENAIRSNLSTRVADSIFSELPNNFLMPELSDNRRAHELDGRQLDSRSPVPATLSPIPSPVSPISSSEKLVGAMKQQIVKPNKSMVVLQSLHGPQDRYLYVPEAGSALSQTNPQNQSGYVESLTVAPIEHDAGLDEYHVQETSQPDLATDWLHLKCNEHDVDGQPRPWAFPSGPTHSNKPEDRHISWSAWKEPHLYPILLQGVFKMIQTLPYSVRIVLPVFQEGAETCLQQWNGELQLAWDSCEYGLSAKDLPFFLEGWFRSLKGQRNALNMSTFDHEVLKQIMPAPASFKSNKLQRTSNITSPRKRKSENSKVLNLPARKSSLIEQWQNAQFFEVKQQPSGSMSPPSMNRSVYSITICES